MKEMAVMRMLIRLRRRAAAALVASGWLCLAVAMQPVQAEPPVPAAGPYPLEAFFSGAEWGEVELSPSGRWLAVVVQPAGLRRALAVYDLHGAEPPRELARFADMDIGEVHWVGDAHLAFDLLDTQRGSADQRLGAGLFTVRRDGGALQQHILMRWWRNPGHGTRISRRLDATHALVHVPEHQPSGAENVIVRGARDPLNPFGDWVLKRLNIATGEVTALNAAEPPHVQRWWFDTQGNPVHAVATDQGQTLVYARTVDDSGALTRQWKLLLQAPSLDLPWALQARDGVGRLYVTQREGPRGETVLKRFDTARGVPEDVAMVAVPGFDFRGGLIQEAAAGQDPVLGLRAWTESLSTVWLHPGMAAVQQAVDARLPERNNILYCRRCRDSDRTVLVVSQSARHPGEVWLWRGVPPEPGVWRRIGVARPAIDPRRMAEVAFTRYTARDGLEVPLWVTLPATPLAGPAPAVVLVHGGPWVRGGHWGWQPLQQFLASRGYVVLEPEFRGSTGFGDRHYRAGWRQWGQAMQDDLADAVQWAATQGLVDARRVCIAGASYGGYAALMGLVRHADTFRCAAAWVPLTDPGWLLREGSPDDWSDEVRRFLLPTLLADRLRDSALIRQISPLEQAARIRAPVLLAWGEEDSRTPPEQAQDMLQALRAAGLQPESVSYKGEGHRWLKTSTWVDFAQRLERFLASSLAGSEGQAPR